MTDQEKIKELENELKHWKAAHAAIVRKHDLFERQLWGIYNAPASLPTQPERIKLTTLAEEMRDALQR